MDGLRADPWVNFEESGPPERLLPKVMGPPIPSQVGQCIASITRDSDFIVYTIRNHTRDGKNFAVHASAFPGAGKGPSGRRASSAGVMPGAGGRRRSSSLVPNAADLRTMQAPSRGRSPSPMDALQRPVIREDGEDEVSELPTTMPRSASPAGGRPPRRMTLNDINRPSPLALEAPLASDGPHSAPVQSSTPVPDPHPSTASLGRAPPARKRRNTINLLLGGLAPQNHSSVGSGSGHFRASTDEPRMIQTGSSDSTSSTAINRLSTTSAGPTFARPVSPSNDTASASGAVSASRRPRRSSVASSIHNGPIPTIVAPTPSFATPAHDRGLTVMRRMSMVQAPASSANSSESLPDPASGPRSAPPLGAGEYPPAFTGDASNQGGVVPSKEEIEGWHLMHRPAREIRAVRYNFNSATTSPLNPAAIFQEVHRVMMLLSRQFDGRLRFERVEDLYMLHCALKEGNEENNVEFEVEVCKIWLLKLHGIRIKRLTGSAFVFKDIYSSVVDALNL
ncbi:MAP microtubule affinity-regulating kinase 1 [Irineochytrium annulatum]|nr:MAP microtubule affinity-regulating kinase 1 [Irineochytrium annulatum]